MNIGGRIKGTVVSLAMTVALIASQPYAAGGDDRPSVIPAKKPGRTVSAETMKRIYEEVKTPCKYGIIIRGAARKAVDCPSIFRHGGKWYMVYVCMNKLGYETHLASSDDLLHWTTLGKILPFRKTGWDAWQGDGGIALHDFAWGGSGALHTFDGKYWMSYIGGALQGYETDPLAIGMAWTTTPERPVEWNRIAENPVLRRDQSDARPFEKETLYKSNIVYDKEQSLPVTPDPK